MAAEALISSMIQKLERRQAMVSCLDFFMICIPCFFDAKKEEVDETIEAETKVIDELKMILDMLRDKKLGEERRLNFFISDLVDMARDALDLYQTNTYPVELESIQSSIADIKMRMLKLGVETESNTRSENVDHEDEDVVGLEEDEYALRTRIIDSNYEYLRTLLVKGMAGIGKTTLARLVYNHADVIDRFDLRAWVCVSTDLTQKEVLMRLIQQVVDSEEFQRDSLLEKMECADNTSLQQMLRRHLHGRRYLIVLDDVPKYMRLESIFKALPDEFHNGSRVLLTSHTTSRSIQFFVRDHHKLISLDSDKSWKLFLKTINRRNKLTSENQFPKNLEGKGREMLKKCGGLPLAIKEAGREIAEKRQLGGDWEQLLESFDLGATLEMLEPFYQKMDPQVKSCFLHLAFFKDNTTMREAKLRQIWSAGGVVSQFHELIDESVIEVGHKSREYHINVVLRRLSIKKAEEEIGFEILSNDGNNRPSRSPRRRVIICNRDKFNYSTNEDKHLVSLFFHGGGCFNASPSYWKGFELLKILDWEDFGLKILPESIGTLMELRYLGLRNNYLQVLPNSLGCLKNLEVLDIAQNFIVQMPDIIWKMLSLRHLYMFGVIFLNPLKIDALENLETLTYVSVDNWTYEVSDLQKMTRLRELGIEELDGSSDVSKLFASLAELKNLENLYLRGYPFISMPCLDMLGVLQRVCILKLDGFLPRLPNSFPPLIRNLKLVNSCLDDDPMPVLRKLHKLRYLKLRNAYTGQQMVILCNEFQGLKFLCIKELWNLRNVQVEKGGMRYLETLKIENCPYLETLPQVMGSTRYQNTWLETNILTTRNAAAKIRKSDSISKIWGQVNINP